MAKTGGLCPLKFTRTNGLQARERHRVQRVVLLLRQPRGKLLPGVLHQRGRGGVLLLHDNYLNSIID